MRERAEKEAKARGGASNAFAALYNLESDEEDIGPDVPAPPPAYLATPAAQEQASKKARQRAHRKAKNAKES